MAERRNRLITPGGSLLLMLLAGCAAISPPPAGPEPASDGREGGMQRDSRPPLTVASLSLLEQARRERGAGELDRAAGTLERALRIDADAPVLWLELARVRLDEGNAMQAEQLGRKARALAAADPVVAAECDRVIAEALHRQGRHQEAEELLSDVG